MKSSLLPSLLLSSLLLAATVFATDSAGENTQSLDGKWDFTTDPAVAEKNTGSWDTLEVPGNWDTQPAYATHKGKGWYQREFTVPADWKGRPVRLVFDAVYHKATVTLNGQSLGSHTGGYTPFEFDVSDTLHYGAANTLQVCADNTYARGAWWPWGGISRSVHLVADSDARIVWQHIDAMPDLVTGSALLSIRYKLANTSDSPLSVSLSSTVAGTSIPPLTAAATIPPKSETIVEASTTLPRADVRLWHFDHPNLYTLESTLQVDDRILHSLRARFGIRKVEVTSDSLLLNGEKVRLTGFNRVSDSNTTGNTEPDALVKKDVDLMKRAGATMTRIMHSPQAPNLLDYLDEKGMLIIAEIPVWGWDDPQVVKDNPLTRQWLKEMIERDYNHPCIIGWSPGNEINNHFNYVASMSDYTRQNLDPHRLFGYVSNTANRSGYTPQNDPVTVSDIACINIYSRAGKDFAAAAESVRGKWPDKPVFFTEYGADQIGGKLSSKIPNLADIWKGIEKNPYVIGASLWTFNDYRSGYKGTPASGNREWGVVTVDREIKDAYWQIRKTYSPVRSLEVTGNTLTVTPRSSADIPSYTLRGYTIKWSLSDHAGKVTAEGTLDLPDLAPDSAAWTAPLPGAGAAAKVTITLISPTGYDVDDWTSPAPPAQN